MLIKALELLTQADNVIVLAGAGLSADLGVPVYWTGDITRYGTAKSEFGYTDLEHAQASLFLKDAGNQIKYFKKMYQTLDSVDVENSYYQKLSNFLASKEDYFVVTSNVDGFMTRSGIDRARLLEIHGSYDNEQCSHHADHGLWRRGAYRACPVCHSPVRPNVMFFYDKWYSESVENVIAAKNYQRFRESANTVVLEIGVGETVPKLLQESQTLRNYYQMPLVRVNPVDHESLAGIEIEENYYHLSMTAADFFSELKAYIF